MTIKYKWLKCNKNTFIYAQKIQKPQYNVILKL